DNAFTHPPSAPTVRAAVTGGRVKRLQARSGTLHGERHLTAARLDELPDLIEQAIARLADQSLTLVDAFDLPERFFALRPIANADYQEAFEDAPTRGDLTVGA
ncbi:hypothetical protein ACWC5I_45930, partial [Kitasatospora sp. NPDC001574]